MRQKFSTRLGLNRPAKLFDNDVPPSLRTRLWNIVFGFYLSNSTSYDYRTAQFASEFFVNFPVTLPTNMPSTPFNLKYVLEPWWDQAEWYELYDFLEFVANYHSLTLDQNLDVKTKSNRFQAAVNQALHDEHSAFIFRNSELIRRLSDFEYEAIESVLELPEGYSAVSIHMKKAFEFFVNRNPDYENAVKESVSAVEAALKIRTALNKGSMSELLNAYSEKSKTHPSLRKAISNLFGFASDFAGVRHGAGTFDAMPEESARLVLAICASSCYFIALSE